MNIGYPCICGCRKVHARLAKYGTTLVVEIRCSKCRNNYTETLALDGLDWIDWERFRQLEKAKESMRTHNFFC